MTFWQLLVGVGVSAALGVWGVSAIVLCGFYDEPHSHRLNQALKV